MSSGKSKIFFVAIFLGIISLIFAYFFYLQKEQKNLEITELKVFENSESSTQPALYVKNFQNKNGEDKKLFLTLAQTQNDEVLKREGLKLLHANTFWDPNRCAQMLNIVGDSEIVFSDTFKNTENDGFTTFIYKYSIIDNSLVGYKVEVSLQKLFTNGQNFYGISKDSNNWILYKINFSTNKLEQIKTYKNDLDLITSGEDLKWCDEQNLNCEVEKSFKFLKKDTKFVQQNNYENPLQISIFYEDKEIFNLKKEDNLGFYILGLRGILE